MWRDGEQGKRPREAVRWTVWRETGYPFGLALAPQPFFWLPRCQVEAPVAQWIEYCPPKAGVAGSIPAGRTNPHEGCDDLPVLLPLRIPG